MGRKTREEPEPAARAAAGLVERRNEGDDEEARKEGDGEERAPVGERTEGASIHSMRFGSVPCSRGRRCDRPTGCAIGDLLFRSFATVLGPRQGKFCFFEDDV